MGAGVLELHESGAPTVLADTVGAEADVLPLSVTGPEIRFELSTTAPVSEVIVTGPATLLPWIATEPLSPFTVTGPDQLVRTARRPGRPAKRDRSCATRDGDRALDR